MHKKHLLMIGIGVGAALLGRKLYKIRKNQAQRTAEENVDNTVDLTSADSFPASDAPSWTPVQSANAQA